MEASKGENITGKVDRLRGDSWFIFYCVTYLVPFNKIENSVLNDEALSKWKLQNNVKYIYSHIQFYSLYFSASGELSFSLGIAVKLSLSVYGKKTKYIAGVPISQPE